MRCPVCKSFEVSRYQEFYNHIYEKQYDIYHCDGCSLQFCMPFESAERVHYEDVKIHDQWYGDRWEFHRVAKKINKDKRIESVLEIACGVGIFLSKLNDDKCKVGLDFNRNAISVAYKNGLNNVYSLTLEEYRKQESKKFDCICFFHLLEHLDDPISFINDCKKLLNKDGLMFFSVPSWKRLELKYDCRENWDYPPHHITRWSMKSIYTLLKNDFNIISVEYEPLNFKYKKGFLYKQICNNIFEKINTNFVRKFLKLAVLPYVYLIYTKNKLLGVSGQAALVSLKKID